MDEINHDVKYNEMGAEQDFLFPRDILLTKVIKFGTKGKWHRMCYFYEICAVTVQQERK